MSSQGYYDWIDAGQPYETCRPGKRVAANIRSHGYTVYEKGNTAHMQAVPPEDHTPFSATGWPNASPRWYGHAIDIMPPTQAMINAGLPTLAQLEAQIHADKAAGVAGAATIKYMNWEPDGPGGKCQHCSWQPSHAVSSSTDRGHCHVSFRSDKTTSSEADSYDPVQRWKDTQGMDATETCNAVWNKDGVIKNVEGMSDYPENEFIAGRTLAARAWERANDAANDAAAALAQSKANGDALARIEAALAGGVEVAAVVQVAPESVAAIADATADEIHNDPERDGV